MMHLLRALCVALALLVPAVQAGASEDEIQDVIEGQLQAFQANDVATAFGFATPGIQQKFGDARTFGRMVQQGYPMVWRPRSHRMGALLQTEAGPVQIVVFEDASGKLYEAGYLMEQIDGVWRIGGVHLRAMPAVGA